MYPWCMGRRHCIRHPRNSPVGRRHPGTHFQNHNPGYCDSWAGRFPENTFRTLHTTERAVCSPRSAHIRSLCRDRCPHNRRGCDRRCAVSSLQAPANRGRSRTCWRPRTGRDRCIPSVADSDTRHRGCSRHFPTPGRTDRYSGPRICRYCNCGCPCSETRRRSHPASLRRIDNCH